MNLDLTKLNPLEKEIYNILTEAIRKKGALRITDAARICGCSPSKISKFSKKLGFVKFRQFVDFAQGIVPAADQASGELERIKAFVTNFQPDMVDAFLSMLQKHERIIILGYGPSYYCAQYLEYKLRIQCSDKYIVAVQDLITAQSQLDSNTLLVIFSVTGHFTSFKQICDETKEKGGDIAVIIEEYSPDLLNDYDNIFFLTDSSQSASLKPHEKSRVIFFIFIEEVMFRLME